VHEVEGGGETDTESAVAVEQAGAGAVRDKVLASDDKHRHLGAVLARVEHLAHGEVRRVEVVHLRKELPVCLKKTASSTKTSLTASIFNLSRLMLEEKYFILNSICMLDYCKINKKSDSMPSNLCKYL
jgi:hypothetical protein